MFAQTVIVYEIINFIQIVCIRIYDLQNVGQYHDLQVAEYTIRWRTNGLYDS